MWTKAKSSSCDAGHAGILRNLGASTALGHAFSSSEGPESDARVAVLSYGLWQGMYRGEESVLRQSIRLNGRNYTIVGAGQPDLAPQLVTSKTNNRLSGPNTETALRGNLKEDACL